MVPATIKVIYKSQFNQTARWSVRWSVGPLFGRQGPLMEVASAPLKSWLDEKTLDNFQIFFVPFLLHNRLAYLGLVQEEKILQISCMLGFVFGEILYEGICKQTERAL